MNKRQSWPNCVSNNLREVKGAPGKVGVAKVDEITNLLPWELMRISKRSWILPGKH